LAEVRPQQQAATDRGAEEAAGDGARHDRYGDGEDEPPADPSAEQSGEGSEEQEANDHEAYLEALAAVGKALRGRFLWDEGTEEDEVSSPASARSRRSRNNRRRGGLPRAAEEFTFGDGAMVR